MFLQSLIVCLVSDVSQRGDCRQHRRVLPRQRALRQGWSQTTTGRSSDDTQCRSGSDSGSGLTVLFVCVQGTLSRSEWEATSKFVNVMFLLRSGSLVPSSSCCDEDEQLLRFPMGPELDQELVS